MSRSFDRFGCEVQVLRNLHQQAVFATDVQQRSDLIERLADGRGKFFRRRRHESGSGDCFEQLRPRGVLIFCELDLRIGRADLRTDFDQLVLHEQMIEDGVQQCRVSDLSARRHKQLARECSTRLMLGEHFADGLHHRCRQRDESVLVNEQPTLGTAESNQQAGRAKVIQQLPVSRRRDAGSTCGFQR